MTGAFIRIALADGSFGYARLLESPYAAFYNYRTTSPDAELDAFLGRPNADEEHLKVRLR